MKHPSLQEEKKLWKKDNYKFVIGLDEAGRGALAGPVVAAAVTVKDKKLKIKGLLKEVKDSKKLTSRKREELYKILINNPTIEWATGMVSEKVIDRINILEATKLAMKRAIIKLGNHPALGRPDFLILDGKIKVDLPFSQRTIIKADEKVFSCAVASILAKVTRDRIMQRYHKKYPQYGFDKHKGYGTWHHIKMLKKIGRCDIHRNSFKYHGSAKTKTYQIKKK